MVSKFFLFFLPPGFGLSFFFPGFLFKVELRERSRKRRKRRRRRRRWIQCNAV